jgi:hypothetical protein
VLAPTHGAGGSHGPLHGGPGRAAGCNRALRPAERHAAALCRHVFWSRRRG